MVRGDRPPETSLATRGIILVALGAAVFHLYAAGISPFTALVQRPIHLAFMALLGFAGLGVQKAFTDGVSAEPAAGLMSPSRNRLAVGASIVLAVLALASCIYLAVENQELVRRSGSPTTLDLILGVIAIIVVLELTRRTTGWALIAVVVLAIAYAFAGPWLPGLLAHRGYTVGRLVEHLYLSTEGIWGIPLGVSADFVYLFILFGAVLDVAGGGALLIALADRIAGRTRGGPAKTAVVASAFMGSLSGSAVANVVTTGAFTIPLMRRAGFKAYFAGAIEAAASTGGQIMPPVMGAGAFILATWTGIPYGRVALSAAIPAILYYAAIMMTVHFWAAKMGIEPTHGRSREKVINRLHLLLPLLIIIALLVAGRSPMRAAFWGVISSLALSLIRPETRLTWPAARKAILSAGAGSVQVAAACAAAGIIVGVASLTGIGLRMSEVIITLSGGNLFAALVLTALGSLVLGMGLPTTAAYVVLAALGAPALVDLGVPLLAAHLFIFYFGCLSNVTPPVALAGYAAAGLAGSPPFKTSAMAMVLALAGFIVPFMFVYGPPLLMIGEPGEIAVALVTALVGVTALAAATMGYGRRRLVVWERMLLVGAAGTLIKPGLLTDGIGLLAFAVVMGRRGARAPAVATPAPAAETVKHGGG